MRSQENQMPFVKGMKRPEGAGRKKGQKNGTGKNARRKIETVVKEVVMQTVRVDVNFPEITIGDRKMLASMVFEAFKRAGGVNYLVGLATSHPAVFASYLRPLLPQFVEEKGGGENLLLDMVQEAYKPRLKMLMEQRRKEWEQLQLQGKAVPDDGENAKDAFHR
jgi:hypothetical protein